MTAAQTLRWLPTTPDGSRWELWRGRVFIGRVYRLGHETSVGYFLLARWKEHPVLNLRTGALLLETHAPTSRASKRKSPASRPLRPSGGG